MYIVILSQNFNFKNTNLKSKNSMIFVAFFLLLILPTSHLSASLKRTSSIDDEIDSKLANLSLQNPIPLSFEKMSIIASLQTKNGVIITGRSQDILEQRNASGKLKKPAYSENAISLNTDGKIRIINFDHFKKFKLRTLACAATDDHKIIAIGTTKDKRRGFQIVLLRIDTDTAEIDDTLFTHIFLKPQEKFEPLLCATFASETTLFVAGHGLRTFAPTGITITSIDLASRTCIPLNLQLKHNSFHTHTLSIAEKNSLLLEGIYTDYPSFHKPISQPAVLFLIYDLSKKSIISHELFLQKKPMPVPSTSLHPLDLCKQTTPHDNDEEDDEELSTLFAKAKVMMEAQPFS